MYHLGDGPSITTSLCSCLYVHRAYGYMRFYCDSVELGLNSTARVVLTQICPVSPSLALYPANEQTKQTLLSYCLWCSFAIQAHLKKSALVHGRKNKAAAAAAAAAVALSESSTDQSASTSTTSSPGLNNDSDEVVSTDDVHGELNEEDVERKSARPGERAVPVVQPVEVVLARLLTDTLASLTRTFEKSALLSGEVRLFVSVIFGVDCVILSVL